MEKVKQITEEIRGLETSLREKRNDLIKALFLDIPNLNKVSLNIKEEYDDNNYYDNVVIQEINGESYSSDIEEYTIDDEGNSDEFKAFCFSVKLKLSEIKSLVNILLYEIPKDHYNGDYREVEIKREDYVK